MTLNHQITNLKYLVFISALTALLAVGVDAVNHGKHPVRAQLLASTSAVRPGGSIDLGILLEMDPGWHTYWQYPGEAGGKTTVNWVVPQELHVGKLLWPVPKKFDEQGIVSYGYAEETLLRAPAFLEDVVAVDSVSIQAEVGWIVCREVCIPGDTVLTLNLPVEDAVPLSADAIRFDRYFSQLPLQLSDGDPVKVAFSTSEGSNSEQFVELVLSIDTTLVGISDTFPDFYPLGREEFDLLVRERDVRLSSVSQINLLLEMIPYDTEAPDAIDGLVVYENLDTGELTYKQVGLDLSSHKLREEHSQISDYNLSVVIPDELPFHIYLLFAVIGGFILNLMPCVFPVISLKVLSFVSQGGGEHKSSRNLGLAFSGGIIATFFSFAWIVVLIKSGGEAIGWGFQFQSSAFVMFLTALVFILSLSLFGLFSVRLPGKMSAFGGGLGRQGIVVNFFNGVLATVLATPCTAPFLGTALGFAFSKTAVVTVVLFSATGLGMALPYVLLAIRPKWLDFLPKPGPWMEHFKQAMGFLLAATALWLLWILGKQLGMEAVIWMMAFLLILAIAGWILGQWIDLGSSARKKTIAWLISLAITMCAYFVFLHPLLVAELPVTGGGERGDQEKWKEFNRETVELLVSEGRTVFVDFTAEWCWTCKVNKRVVLESEEVREKFKSLDIALVRADWTNRNPEITEMLSGFGRSGIPLYVIFYGGRMDKAMVLPEIITSGIVIESLMEAVEMSEGL